MPVAAVPDARTYRHLSCRTETTISDQPFDVMSNPLSDMASARNDGDVRIWDIRQQQAVVLPEHRSDVMSVHWHPQDENLVVSASTDGTIRIRNLQEQQTERINYPLPSGKSVTLGGDGRLLKGAAETLEEEIVFLVKEGADDWQMLKPSTFWNSHPLEGQSLPANGDGQTSDISKDLSISIDDLLYLRGQLELQMVQEDLLIIAGLGDAAFADFHALPGGPHHVHHAEGF